MVYGVSPALDGYISDRCQDLRSVYEIDDRAFRRRELKRGLRNADGRP
jgi:hypothetical protein